MQKAQGTFPALGIVALLDVPLFVVYLSIAARVTATASATAVTPPRD